MAGCVLSVIMIVVVVIIIIIIIIIIITTNLQLLHARVTTSITSPAGSLWVPSPSSTEMPLMQQTLKNCHDSSR